MNIPFSRCISLISTCLAVLLVISPTVDSHAQGISAQQIEKLRRLSTQQQKRISDSLGLNEQKISQPSANRNSFDIQTRPIENDVAKVVVEQRFGPGDSLVLELKLNDARAMLLNEVRDSLGKRIYVLDGQGNIEAPGIGPVLLAGLTAEEAQLRLEAEPVLREVSIAVYRLPISAVGKSALKSFGYDLFSNSAQSFDPTASGPVPVGYTIGVGDVLSLLIYGQLNAEYQLQVGRDGQIQIPEIGPVAIAGLSYEQLREELNSKIQERYIGVNISLSLSEFRSIQVFVLGDVKEPGSYTLNSMSTMMTALTAAGGVTEFGSLRQIQLKRRNALVGSLDVYDLLLKGNTRDDRQLRSGDVVYVNSVGGQVAVFGEVVRPALYELRDETSLTQVIELAGGLRPSAYKENVTIEKFNNLGSKSLVTADLSAGRSYAISAGDQIEIRGALAEVSDEVRVVGHVKRETSHQWRQGMRLLDVIPDAAEFKLQAEQDYMVVRREDPETGRLSLLPVSWRAAKRDPMGAVNPQLETNDTVYVFGLSSDRADLIKPLINELRSQASFLAPVETVSVLGHVRAAGEYPYRNGMRISDLIRAAGSTLDNAYLDEIEITRIQREKTDRTTVHINSSLNGLVPGSLADLFLAPNDVLTIKEIPLWRERLNVVVEGEIRFPGEYAARRGERISEVISRAGGLTEMAFPDGSVFLRNDLKEREKVQMDRLADRIRVELGTFEGPSVESKKHAENLLQQLEEAEPLGRLVIDLELALLGNAEHDIILEDGDRLVIPSTSQEVTVIGEVQYPTSHIYEDRQNQYSYIQKSGGLTANADSKRIYVIRADGKVIANQGNNWFRRSGDAILVQPGDSIVVPLDADRIGKLSLWSNVSQIVYNIGIAAAAIASF